MKALKISLIVTASLLIVFAAGYLYASSGLTSKPGYAKLALPEGPSVNGLFSINIGPSGVKPVRWLVGLVADDFHQVDHLPKRLIDDTLQDLQGIQLRVYEVGGNRHVFDEAIADTLVHLKEKNWQTLASIREDDVKIAVLQYGHDHKIEGLSVMASTPDRALFLNLIGPFDANAIAEKIELAN